MDRTARDRQPRPDGGTVDGWHHNERRPLLQELRSEALAPLRRLEHAPPPGFAVLTSGRSGSELLRELLGCHPAVFADLEILDRPVRFPRAWVSSRRLRHRRSVYGFKVKLQDLTRFQGVEPEPFFAWLHDGGYRLIHLRRDNIVLQALSVVRARHSGEYHRLDAGGSTPRRVIDPDEVVAACGHQLDQQRREVQVLAPFPHHTVVYEPDLDDRARWQATADGLFEFLGLETVPVTARLGRTRGRSMELEIENWPDVRDALADAGYAAHLELADG